MKLLFKSSLSLLSAAMAMVLTGCSSEEDLKGATEYVPLDIATVSAAGNTLTRAAIDAEAFPVADAASLGLFVTKEDGSAYNSQSSGGYNNVAYTKAADATAWTCTSPILLSSTAGRLYGYYPYSAEATDSSVIPVASSVDGDDYMYLSAPTTTINRETAMPVSITMQHALSRLDLTFVKDEAVSAASLTSFTLSGDGVATTGTMNILDGGVITATKATSGFTYSPECAVALTTSNTFKCLLVPATQEAKDLKISCVINGVTFEKTLTSVALLPATRIAVTLTLQGTDVEISNVSVTGWTTTEAPGVEAQTITATVAPFIDEDGNPIDYYTFQWQENDQLGISPLDKAQIAFEVKEVNGNIATVDGGSWGVLRPGYSYAAYYPFSEDNNHREITKLPVDYTDQIIDGEEPLAHLGKYDYLVSASAQVSANGNVNLGFKHLGCIARFVLKIPEPGEYRRLALYCYSVPFTTEATYNLSATAPALTPTYQYSTLKVALKNIVTTTSNEEVVIYTMMPPVNQEGKTLTLTLVNSEGKEYITTVPGKSNMVAGKVYEYQPTASFNEKTEFPMAKFVSGKTFIQKIKTLARGSSVSYYDIDNRIKEIRFDTNSQINDGEVVSSSDSDYPIYAKYANGIVTISTAAEKISGTDMSDMFHGCEALTSLDLSSFNTENVTTMARMFEYCPALTSLDLSSFNTRNVTDMSDMFWLCTALTSLNLSSFNTENVTTMSGMFRDCSSLTSLDLSSFNTQNVTTMGGMFEECRVLTSLDLSSFNIHNDTSKSRMFFNCALRSPTKCTITCTEATQSAIKTDSYVHMVELSYRWNIINN